MQDIKKALRAIVGSITNSGISPSDIVILSKYKKCNSILADLSSIQNLQIVEQKDIMTHRANCLNYYTVQSYKGLESNFVILVDIDGFNSDNDIRINYVGMTRAKIGLYMILDQKIKPAYDSATLEGIQKI